jgi:hypothetical protein
MSTDLPFPQANTKEATLTDVRYKKNEISEVAREKLSGRRVQSNESGVITLCQNEARCGHVRSATNQ